MSSADRRSIPLDDVFELLAESQRRALVCCLLSDGGGTVDDLAGRIVARDRGGSVDDPAAARERLEVSLVHDHLPRLNAHGFVDYDPEGGVVEPGDRFEVLAEVVEVDGDEIHPPTRG